MNDEKDVTSRSSAPRSRFRAGGSILLLLAGLAAGYFGRGFLSREVPPAPPSTGEVAVKTEEPEAAGKPGKKAPRLWTCAMHPQIQLPKPGRCPICNMELIPLEGEAEGAPSPRVLAVSREAAELMEIETVPVRRRFVKAEVRMVGKIDFDETRLKYITAWLPGRLDRLFVDYTGVPVRKGDHMVYLYSPELLSAQEELLQALETVRSLEDSDSRFVRETAEATVAAARDKLRLWGLTTEQIAEIEKRGEPTDHMTIYAPTGGIVVHKNAQEGMYVNTGTRIYTIADLSHVWVRLDAYESDLPWLRYGQKLTFTVESYPGELFHGTIAFIDPVLTRTTRTVKVRVDAENPGHKLKPGMFVRAVARAEVAGEGRVMDPSLEGKWICPMHPGVVKDGPGTCDRCGMELVTTESLGYAGASTEASPPPLVIPASAPLITGTRAVVYVKLPGKDTPTFEGREIVLGPRAGDFYLVREGLEEGDLVVTRGAFKIDAELQIRAKPSMMTPEGGGGGGGGHGGMKMDEGAKMEEKASLTAPSRGERKPPPVKAAFRKGLVPLVDAYLALEGSLAADDPQKAGRAVQALHRALESLDPSVLAEENRRAWTEHRAALEKLLADGAGATDLAGMRRAFASLSGELLLVLRRFGLPPGRTLFRIHCPMAFDNRGADWLQADEDVRNPYFGAAMLGCGEVVEKLHGGTGGDEDE